MGGGGSKEKAEYFRAIDTQLNNQFEVNCLASAESIQELTLEDTSVIMRDNCKISFMNKVSVNSTCNMTPIIDAIAEMVVNGDQKLAETLQATQDRQANAQCEADNCKDRLTISVTNNLKSSCENAAKSKQSLKMIGGTIICDGNAVAEHGNFSEVKATCLRSLLRGGVEEVFGTENLGGAPPPSSPLDSKMIIMGALALIVVIILIRKKE